MRAGLTQSLARRSSSSIWDWVNWFGWPPAAKEGCEFGAEKERPQARASLSESTVEPASTLRGTSARGRKRAGTPTARLRAGTDLVTTEPAPMTAPSPIVTPPLCEGGSCVSRGDLGWVKRGVGPMQGKVNKGR